jgi:hypothetical protein
MLRCAIVVVICFLFASSVVGQQPRPDAVPPAATDNSTPQLSPSEAYKYATQPFYDARSAPNDLTDADQWALGQAIARAQKECEALKNLPLQPPPPDRSAPKVATIPAGKTVVVTSGNVSKEYADSILDVAKLCTFGQDLEPAREALVDYLSLPGIDEAKTAHLLLARVFVGLGWYTSAESQMDSLVSLFPYDGDTHLAIDQTIDASEAGNDADVVARLNNLQLPYTLKALATGGTLKGNENQIDAATFAEDALRCADAMRRAGKIKDAASLVEMVKAPTSVPPIAQTASKPKIDNALARYAMVGQPVRSLLGADGLRGELLLKTGRTLPTVKLLTGRTTVLIAFSLGAPASGDVFTKFAAGLRQAKLQRPIEVVAITSYAATNGVDKKDEAVLKALESFVATLPTDVSVLLVPAAAIQAFAIDAYPAAVVIDRAGRVAFLNLITGTNGSIHQLLQAVLPAQAQRPPAQ